MYENIGLSRNLLIAVYTVHKIENTPTMRQPVSAIDILYLYLTNFIQYIGINS